jgi:hypothetical protein
MVLVHLSAHFEGYSASVSAEPHARGADVGVGRYLVERAVKARQGVLTLIRSYPPTAPVGLRPHAFSVRPRVLVFLHRLDRDRLSALDHAE